jgi:hypothetical protein
MVITKVSGVIVELMGKPYFKNTHWFQKVVYRLHGNPYSRTLVFTSKEDAKTVSIGQTIEL